MNAGSMFAIAFFGGVTLAVLYGLACDVHRWWEDRNAEPELNVAERVHEYLAPHDELERAWRLPAAHR